MREDVLTRAEEVLRKYRNRMGTTEQEPTPSKNSGIMGSIANAGRKVIHEVVHAGEVIKDTITGSHSHPEDQEIEQGVPHSDLHPEWNAGSRSLHTDVSTKIPSRLNYSQYSRPIEEQRFQEPTTYSRGIGQTGLESRFSQDRYRPTEEPWAEISSIAKATAHSPRISRGVGYEGYSGTGVTGGSYYGTRGSYPGIGGGFSGTVGSYSGMGGSYVPKRENFGYTSGVEHTGVESRFSQDRLHRIEEPQITRSRLSGASSSHSPAYRDYGDYKNYGDYHDWRRRSYSPSRFVGYDSHHPVVMGLRSRDPTYQHWEPSYRHHDQRFSEEKRSLKKRRSGERDRSFDRDRSIDRERSLSRERSVSRDRSLEKRAKISEKKDVSKSPTKKKGLKGMVTGLATAAKVKGEHVLKRRTKNEVKDHLLHKEEPFEYVYASVKVRRYHDDLGMLSVFSRKYRDEGFFVTLKIFRKSLFHRGLTDRHSVMDFLRIKQITLDELIDYHAKNQIKEMLGLSKRDEIKLELVDDLTVLGNTAEVKPVGNIGHRMKEHHADEKVDATKKRKVRGILGLGDFRGEGILQGRDPIATLLKGVAGEIEHTVTGRRDLENPDRPGHLFKRDGETGPVEPEYGRIEDEDHSKDVEKKDKSVHKKGLKAKILGIANKKGIGSALGVEKDKGPSGASVYRREDEQIHKKSVKDKILDKVLGPKFEEQAIENEDEHYVEESEHRREDEHAEEGHKRGIKEKIHDTVVGIKDKVMRPKHEEEVDRREEEDFASESEYRSEEESAHRASEVSHKKGIKDKIQDTVVGIKDKIMGPKHDEHVVDKRDERAYHDEYEYDYASRDTHAKKSLKERALGAFEGVKSTILGPSTKEEDYGDRYTHESQRKQKAGIFDKSYLSGIPQYESTYVRPNYYEGGERSYGRIHDYKGRPVMGHRDYPDRGYGIESESRRISDSRYYDKSRRVDYDESLRY